MGSSPLCCRLGGRRAFALRARDRHPRSCESRRGWLLDGGEQTRNSRSFPQPHSATARMTGRASSTSIRLDKRCKEATMRVSELMTEKVLTIGPEAPIKDVAKILVANGISGLPVCDIERRVLGVVSEGDILYKEHDPTEGRIGGPLGWVIDGTVNHAASRQGEGAYCSEGDDVARDHDRPVGVGRDGCADHVRASRQPTAGREGRAARRDRHPRRPRPCLHPHGRRDRAGTEGGHPRAHHVDRPR